MTRSDLEARYLTLVRDALPQRAASEIGWPVRLDHCFMRIVLDHIFQACWYDHLDRSRNAPAAYRQLTDAQLALAMTLAESLLDLGPAHAGKLNQQSLVWRGKA